MASSDSAPSSVSLRPSPRSPASAEKRPEYSEHKEPAQKESPRGPAVRFGVPSPKALPGKAPHTKLLLVDFRSGETVCTHPAVAPLVGEGWHVQSAAPRVTPDGTKLLVVLTRFPPPTGRSLCR